MRQKVEGGGSQRGLSLTYRSGRISWQLRKGMLCNNNSSRLTKILISPIVCIVCVYVWVCAPTISKSRATHTNNNPNFGTHAFPTHRKCCVERVRERAREGERQQHAHLRDTTRVFRNGVCEPSVFLFLQKVFQIFLYFFRFINGRESGRESEREGEIPPRISFVIVKYLLALFTS